VKGTLDSLIRRAFSVAKKVRTETGIARSAVSIAHTAATLARDIFGDLKQRAVLMIGAGEMGRLAARHLAAGGVKEIVVVNRSFQRGVDLARELGGRASPYDRLFEEIDRADVVITSTAAPHQVVRREDAPRLRRARRGRPLFFVDMGVPRNIDPRINDIDGFYLYDIDELGQVVQEHMSERRKEAICAEAIVERETDAFIAWFRSLQVAPTIVDLRAALQALGNEEFERFRGKFGDLTERQRNLVEQYTSALINKLLHRPIRALKRAAAEQGGDGRVEFLRQAFGLGPARIEPAKKDPEAGHDDDAQTCGKDDGQPETGNSAGAAAVQVGTGGPAVKRS
jgi:glutamyl-tRNA reductase